MLAVTIKTKSFFKKSWNCCLGWVDQQCSESVCEIRDKRNPTGIDMIGLKELHYVEYFLGLSKKSFHFKTVVVVMEPCFRVIKQWYYRNNGSQSILFPSAIFKKLCYYSISPPQCIIAGCILFSVINSLREGNWIRKNSAGWFVSRSKWNSTSLRNFWFYFSP